MHYTTKRLFILLFSFVSLQLSAQKFVNEFLNIGVGARAHGMFGSVVAHVGDGTAGYWNPAGLARINSPLEINAMHANWFGGIANYDYVSIAKRFGKQQPSAAGISIIRMSVDNIPNTLNLIGPDGTVDVNRVTKFSTTDLGVLLSYSKSMDKKRRFYVGGNIKIINRSIGEFGSAWGFGADLGAQWRGDNISFGVAARDITTTWNTWTFNLTESEKNALLDANNEIPKSSTESTLPRVIVGAAFHGKLNKIGYLFEADLNISTDGRKSGLIASQSLSADPSLGLELNYARRVFLRAGIGNIQSVLNPTNAASRDFEFQPNVGLGLALGRIKIDYALTNIGSTSGALASQLFSLSLSFSARKDHTAENF